MELNKYKDLVESVLNKINRDYNLSSIDMIKYLDELELIQKVHKAVLTGGEQDENAKIEQNTK